MERTFQDYLSQRWEDLRTPTPEYAPELMNEHGFSCSHRIDELNGSSEIVVSVVKGTSHWRKSSYDKYVCREMCKHPQDIEGIVLRLQRDSFKQAFRHYPDVRKALWLQYRQDCKWAQRQAWIHTNPQMDYLNYCQFLP